MTAAAGEGRDHGGGLDAAIARWGGTRAGWLDLSTGINPVPYPADRLSADAWSALPDRAAMARLESAARAFWQVPDACAIVTASGASALIARMPDLAQAASVHIPRPTYNEHAAAFAAAGYAVADRPQAPVAVFVHPNNPDGRLWEKSAIAVAGRDLTIVDESFCDVMPSQSLVGLAEAGRVVVLKSFGKFWGLAGLRLGFAIGTPGTLTRPGDGRKAPHDLAEMLGPWAVSGPALEIGARALADHGWAAATRLRLAADAARLDRMMTDRGAAVAGGTSLFRLYAVDDAARWQDRLAQGRVWSRIFPYSQTWLRLGLPHPDRWDQLQAAL
jgi:cobalamin biosynthetic protein CobC